jgi:C-terminal of Roc, COR, domain/Ras of Complex, Roc, domain of DAPkinase
VLLVGEGGTGKSSLLRALRGQEFEEGLDTTHGIAVENLPLPHPQLAGQMLTLNAWDFGGQDIYHATHQFFLTRRSVYVVVWNARTGSRDSKLDYWLDTIHVLAPDAPVLLVATHIDERAPDLNVQQYRSAYHQILSNIVVLKPNWVTKAISLVLEDPATRAAHGILAHADLPRIWSVDEDGRAYARSLYPIFLRLMERFDLSYQIEPGVPGQSPTHSLIPQLLPHQEPDEVQRVWPPDSTQPGQMHVEMVYRFDFVPAGIMSWFIVRTHRYTRKLHWRDGAILSYEGHVARIELFPMLRELRIVVWGIQPYTFFVILKETLDLILTRFAGLQVRREVPCTCQSQIGAATPCREVYRYEEDLVSRYQNNRLMIECRASYKEVPVLELLYGIHSVTTPQVQANVEAGYQEILRRLDTLQQKDDLLLQQVSLLAELNVRNFTRLWNLEMQRLEAECPNTFFLIPEQRRAFNPKKWIGYKYTMYLVCQHPPGPHIVDEEHGYALDIPKERWKELVPWLKRIITFLNEADKSHYWGGLQRVPTEDGNILWLCGEHAKPYAVQPLRLE